MRFLFANFLILIITEYVCRTSYFMLSKFLFTVHATVLNDGLNLTFYPASEARVYLLEFNKEKVGGQ